MMRVWLKRIGARVKKVRADLGEKQEAFGKRIHVSRAQLSIIENGSRSYGIEPLLHVLAGLDKDGSDLDPVRSLLDLARGLNSITADDLAACRSLIEALSDSRRTLALGLMKTLALGSGSQN